jgi:o-succinylbenzoate synthase
MRIARAQLLPYAHALAEPFGGGSVGTWTERRGVLLRLESEGGLVGQGEAAPLPGYSPDTLAGARENLEALLSSARGWELDPCLPLPPQIARLDTGLGAISPAARCAVQTALLDLAGQRAGAPVSWLLSGRPPADERPAARLLGGPALMQAAQRAWSEGYRTLKVKIGAAGKIERELADLRALRACLPEASLRLDANGAWTLEEAARHLPRLGELGPELVEQPVPAEQLEALAAPGAPRLAADESLQDPDRAQRLAGGEHPSVRVLVLKPSVLGGPLAAWRLAERARCSGLAVVVSHLLEGPVGFAACAELALGLPPGGPACGLGPHPGLTGWPEAFQPPQAGGPALRASGRAGLGLPAWEPSP